MCWAKKKLALRNQIRRQGKDVQVGIILRGYETLQGTNKEAREPRLSIDLLSNHSKRKKSKHQLILMLKAKEAAVRKEEDKEPTMA